MLLGGVGAGHAQGIARAACKPGDKALCFGGGQFFLDTKLDLSNT